MDLESLGESKPEFSEVLTLKRALNEAEEKCRRQEDLRRSVHFNTIRVIDYYKQCYKLFTCRVSLIADPLWMDKNISAL